MKPKRALPDSGNPEGGTHPSRSFGKGRIGKEDQSSECYKNLKCSTAVVQRVQLMCNAAGDKQISSDDETQNDVGITEHVEVKQGEDLLSNDLELRPIYSLREWKDPVSKDQRMSIAILLLRGVGEIENDIK
eukprot:IDg13644t1